MILEELKATHWASLKKMVEDAGGVYENKEKSIQFLLETGAVLEKPVEEKPVSDIPGDDIPTVKLDAPALVGNKKAAIELDKSKPFGEIFGEVEGFPSARYSQGEHLFNSKGEKL